MTHRIPAIREPFALNGRLRVPPFMIVHIKTLTVINCYWPETGAAIYTNCAILGLLDIYVIYPNNRPKIRPPD